MDRAQILSELCRYFASRPERLVAVWLFGSVARGEERPGSDVDVGVLLDANGPLALADLDRLARMQLELGDLLGHSVDLVPMNGAPLDLLHRLLGDGVLLFEADHERRLEFEVLARSEYFDFAPYLERYRRDVLRRV